MNADALKKLTTESLNELAAMLDQGHSERLTSLLATMARFHRYSLHNVCLLCRARHNRHHADSRIMPIALSHPRDRGGDRALPEISVGIIRGARETRGVDRVGGTGLVSHRSAWCVPAPAL